MVSSFTPRETGFFPEEHRIKDIGDLISVMKFYSSRHPELRPLYEQFIKEGNPEIMKKFVEEIPEKLTTTFAFSGSRPSPLNFYTSMFAGSASTSVGSGYASLFTSKSGEAETSKSVRVKEEESSRSVSGKPSPSPYLHSTNFFKYHPYYYPYPSLPSFWNSSSISSSPSYPSSSSSNRSSSASSSGLLSKTPPIPLPRLPPLPTLFPRNIDLNNRINKLIYSSVWRSELSYV